MVFEYGTKKVVSSKELTTFSISIYVLTVFFRFFVFR
jgi:hypothetical protein